jgi:hypothetical protein
VFKSQTDAVLAPFVLDQFDGDAGFSQAALNRRLFSIRTTLAWTVWN